MHMKFWLLGQKLIKILSYRKINCAMQIVTLYQSYRYLQILLGVSVRYFMIDGMLTLMNRLLIDAYDIRN